MRRTTVESIPAIHAVEVLMWFVTFFYFRGFKIFVGFILEPQHNLCVCDGKT